MPIKDLTDEVRIPRLGKIHLGYRDPQRGFPVKTDYFVFPKDHSDYPMLVKVFGERPKELRILIPVEDEEMWASQYYKAYNLTRGLVCKGDGDNAVRMVDTKTGALPDKDTATVTMKDIICAGRECPEYKAKKCGEVMNLRFMLPEIPGLGVWQIDTGSINSILNINSCAKVIRKTFGRLTLVPLILSLEPVQVNNPETGKKQTVYILHLRTNVTLKQLAENAREQAKTLMLTTPDLEAVYDAQLQEDIDTLYGPAPQKAEPEVMQGTIVSSSADRDFEAMGKDRDKLEAENKKANTKQERDPGTIKNMGELYTACKEDFGLKTWQQVWAELNINSQEDITDTPAECYKKILAIRQ